MKGNTAQPTVEHLTPKDALDAHISGNMWVVTPSLGSELLNVDENDCGLL